jgi:hypothetical protein
MNECQKWVARLECHCFAVSQALPELKDAVNTLAGVELSDKINEIGARFNLIG